MSASLWLMVCLCLAVAHAGSAAGPVPAPLSTAPPPSLPAAGEPPRALPAAVTICRSGTDLHCWVRAGESTCAPDGEPFRVVPDREAEVTDALSACRTPADG